MWLCVLIPSVMNACLSHAPMLLFFGQHPLEKVNRDNKFRSKETLM